MKLLNLSKDGKKLNISDRDNLVSELNTTFVDAGYITMVTVLNSSTITIGRASCTFIINTEVHENNYIIDNIDKPRETALLTLEQIVEVHRLISSVLHACGVTCLVSLGGYTVELGSVHYNETAWLEVMPEMQQCVETGGLKIVSEMQLGADEVIVA